MSSKGQSKFPPAPLPPELTDLPRPVYGHAESLPNRVLGYRHRHAWVQFAYAAEGVLEVHTDDARYIAPPQRAVWIPAGIPHRIRCAAKTAVRSLYISHTTLEAPHQRCRVLVVKPLLRELIRTFGDLPAVYAPDSPAERLAGVLLDEISCSQEVDLVLPLPAHTRLRQLCRQFYAHPAGAITLAEWSLQLGVSEKTLSRLFLKETGLTFRAWVQRTRLLTALEPLERGERVTDVALDCGYESLSAFISAFAKLFNTTPGEFSGR